MSRGGRGFGNRGGGCEFVPRKLPIQLILHNSLSRRRTRRVSTTRLRSSRPGARYVSEALTDSESLIKFSELGTFVHAVEDEMLCSSVMPDKVPYFNAPIYLQNKSQIGKVDEILGPINEVFFSIKMGEGMVASSFKKGDKVYIGGDKLLPIDRFLPKPKVQGGI